MINKLVGHHCSDDIWRLKNFNCAIGSVVFAHFKGMVTIVQKTPVVGYELSEKWAFPGGLVRGTEVPSLSNAIVQSVKSRALSEAGLILRDIEFLDGEWSHLCPITRYTVRGTEQFTLVIPTIAKVEFQQELRTDDQSIKDAKWQLISSLSDLDLAPANALIAHTIINHTYRDQFPFPHPQNAQRFSDENFERVFGQDRRNFSFES